MKNSEENKLMIHRIEENDVREFSQPQIPAAGDCGGETGGILNDGLDVMPDLSNENAAKAG
jgi:hypothetical protein